MVAARAALAPSTGDALVNEVADRDGGSDHSEEWMRVAGEAAAGEPLQLAIAVADRVSFRTFDFAATFGAGKMKHDVIPSKHRLDCRWRKGCTKIVALFEGSSRKRPEVPV